MPEITCVRDAEESGANVQSGAGVQSVALRLVDGKETVVVMCARCPNETPLDNADDESGQPWSVVLVDDGHGVAHKVLCRGCRRDLAVWFLSSPTEARRG